MALEENSVDPIVVQTDPAHQEGIAHIKEKLYERNGAPAVPPVDSTAGLSEQQPGLIDSVKSYLGYGNPTTKTTGTATEAGTTDGPIPGSDSTLTSTSTSTPQATSTSAPQTTATSTPQSSAPHNQGADTLAPKTTEADKVNADVSKTTSSTDAATGAQSNPSNADQADTKAPEEPAQHAAPKPGNAGSLEHRDAIPTAGGVRLGDKHWGESDVVPDLPPKQDEGNADATTQANTAKNAGSTTGSTTESATGEHHDPSVIDKIKAKLPGHKKD